MGWLSSYRKVAPHKIHAKPFRCPRPLSFGVFQTVRVQAEYGRISRSVAESPGRYSSIAAWGCLAGAAEYACRRRRSGLVWLFRGIFASGAAMGRKISRDTKSRDSAREHAAAL